MCGRFVVSYTYDQLVAFLGNAFDIFDLDENVAIPNYNVAPGQQVISVISDGTNYRVGTLKWGLVPSFSKDEKSGYKMINARRETIHIKPSFKQSFFQKRCVILANGFYEWKRKDGSKKPHYITLNDQEMFLMAGLWSGYQKEDGSMLYTTTIITTEANEKMSDLHDRMPVILDLDAARVWLNPKERNIEILDSLLTQYPNELIDYYEVSNLVNNVRNNDVECIQEAK